MGAVPAWVRGYVGLPYASGGRTRAGVDCWGLFALVRAEQFGRPLPDYEGPLFSGADSAADVQAAADAYARQFRRINPGDEAPGDGILIRMLGGPLHLAMVVGPGQMLHVERGCDAVVEPYDSFRWSRRIIAFYRHEVPDA